MERLFGEDPPSRAGPAETLPDAPLATRMRPHTLEEFVGQDHLLAPGSALRRALEEGSAVQAGRAEVRGVIERARERLNAGGRRTIFFLDEIHRFNKAQQDAL